MSLNDLTTLMDNYRLSQEGQNLFGDWAPLGNLGYFTLRNYLGLLIPTWRLLYLDSRNNNSVDNAVKSASKLALNYKPTALDRFQFLQEHPYLNIYDVAKLIPSSLGFNYDLTLTPTNPLGHLQLNPTTTTTNAGNTPVFSANSSDIANNLAVKLMVSNVDAQFEAFKDYTSSSSTPKPSELVDLKLDTETPESLKTDVATGSNFKTQAAGAVGGVLGGAAAGYGMSALGNAIGANNSKGTLFGWGLASNAVSSAVGSGFGSAASGIAKGGFNVFRNFGTGVKNAFAGNAGNYTNFGIAAANLALDTFDPVKKAKWESAVNLGIGMLGLIPGFGTAAAAVGLLFNGVGHLTGKRLARFKADKDVLAQGGASYGASTNNILKAESESGTKFSGYNTGAYNRAFDNQMDARLQYWTMNDVVSDSNDRLEAAKNNNNFNSVQWSLDRSGGWNPVSVGRNGMILNRTRSIIEKYKKGKKIPKHWDKSMLPKNKPSFEEWVTDIPEEWNGKLYDLKSAYEYYPFDMMERWKYAVTSDDPEYYMKYQDDNGEYIYHTGSIVELPNGDYMFLKLGAEQDNPELHFETDTYHDGSNGLKETHDLVYEGDRYYYRKKKPIEKHQEGGIIELTIPTTDIQLVIPDVIEEFKEGGSIETSDKEPEKDYVVNMGIKVPVDQIESFQNGGSVNVIPEGALHARKHNIEMDGITKKGIPVIDNEGTQQAEIEHSEIIFRLEVTQKLEELSKTYYKEDSSNKEKDESALEAGKLLVKEILHNTIDNTNNLL